MKIFLKSIIKPIYYLFVDKYAFDRNIPVLTRLWVTTRHKLASKGVFLYANERKLSSLKNIHNGERCFIIGNGPSLMEFLPRRATQLHVRTASKNRNSTWN